MKQNTTSSYAAQALDPIRHKTELRLSLLSRGYVPLPLIGKAPRLRKWSKLAVTPEMIRGSEWDRSGTATNTGIRCDNVVGVDLDIGDADLLSELDAGLDGVPVTPFVRIGRAPREMWLYRSEAGGACLPSVCSYALRRDYEPFAAARDEALARKASMDELTGLRTQYPYEAVGVDIIGPGKQFAAFGVHPGTGGLFTWVDGALPPPVDELPLLGNNDIRLLCSAFEALMDGRDEYIKVHRSRTDGRAFEVVAKLRMDTLLPTLGHGVLSVAEALALGNFSDRCAACGIEGLEISVDPHNSLVSVQGGDIFVTNFPSGQVCTLARDAARPVEAVADDPEPSPDQDHKVNMQRVAARYALTGGSIIDRINGVERKVSDVRNLWRPCSWTETDDKGKAKLIDFTSAALLAGSMVQVSHAEASPQDAVPVYWRDDVPVLNTWRPAALPVVGGDAGPFFELLGSLLPIEEEREEFIKWCACAVQRRGVRRYGVMMVAENTTGSGRESLFKILRALLGGRNVRAVTMPELLGSAGQGQYTDWLAGRELYTISEFLDGSQSAFAVRKAMEAVKEYVDPGRVDYRIMRKTFANFDAVVYGSMIIATNNMDALKMDDSDRRLGVFRNTTKLNTGFGRWINAEWLPDLTNIGALYRELMAVDLSGWNCQQPPKTTTRSDMIEATQSYVEQIADTIIQALLKEGFTDIQPPSLVRGIEQVFDAQAGSGGKLARWGSGWHNEAAHCKSAKLFTPAVQVLKVGGKSYKVRSLLKGVRPSRRMATLDDVGWVISSASSW